MNAPFTKKLFRWFFALSFVYVGVLHFIEPDPFLRIVPPVLPWPLALVYISGFFEIAGGIGVLIPRTRKMAGWGIIALLIAVYPANIYMLTHEVYLEGMPQETWLLWLRMPFQFVFAAWTLWVADIWPRKSEKKSG